MIVAGRESCVTSPSVSPSPTASPIQPSPSVSPSQSLSPSPSPSTIPYYQIRIEESKTLCVTEGCLQTVPWDNITTRINIYYQRGVLQTQFDPPIPELYAPPIEELTNMPALTDITLHTRTTEQCYDPYNSINCVRSRTPPFSNNPVLVAFFAPFCDPCVNSEWVPTWFTDTYTDPANPVSYAPQIVQNGVYPNFQFGASDSTVIGAVVSCKDILEGPFRDAATWQIVTFPMGSDYTYPDGTVGGGPCWPYPYYGEIVCAPGGADPTGDGVNIPGVTQLYVDEDGTQVYSPQVRDMDGNPYPQQPDANGNWGRWLSYQCPSASNKKDL